jgi:UDP-N-acetylmuramyl tripeptide synthase
MLRLLVAGDDKTTGLMLALNDAGPDGRDVSWIWDADLDLCRARTSSIVVSGRRAHDMALRLKLAGCYEGQPISEGGELADIIIEPDVVRAFWAALERVPPGERVCVLPTYTAMWTLRAELARLGHVGEFWEQ